MQKSQNCTQTLQCCKSPIDENLCPLPLAKRAACPGLSSLQRLREKAELHLLQRWLQLYHGFVISHCSPVPLRQVWGLTKAWCHPKGAPFATLKPSLSERLYHSGAHGRHALSYLRALCSTWIHLSSLM